MPSAKPANSQHRQFPAPPIPSTANSQHRQSQAPPIPRTANSAAAPAPHLRSPVTPRTAKPHANLERIMAKTTCRIAKRVGRSWGGNLLSLGVAIAENHFAQIAVLGVPASRRTARNNIVALAEKGDRTAETDGGKRLCVNASSKVKIGPLRQSAPASAATPNPRERLGMQMRAPYKDTIEKIFQEITVFLSSPRAQAAGPESFDKLAKGYAELFRVCNGNSLEDIFAPIATLAPEYLGVPDVNGLLRGDYAISSPDAEVDSPVLAVTDKQLNEMRGSGQKLPDCVSCVLVPTKPRRKIDDTFEVFQSQCKGNGNKEEDLTGFMLLEDFFGRLTERGQRPEMQRSEAEGKDPVNVLSLSAEILGSAFREPEAVTTLRYRLLSVLSKRSIGHSTETGIGKLTNPIPRPNPNMDKAWDNVQKRAETTIQNGALDEVNPWLERTGLMPYFLGMERPELLASVEEPKAEEEPVASAYEKPWTDWRGSAKRPLSTARGYSCG
ncbi:hypothetical protein PSPO01_15506 [Paraphaeosphaeria sporulosa]